jgi:23S rRNA (uracil1939-C5)-methyltransferase
MVILTVSGNPDYSLSREHIQSLIACLREAVFPEKPDSYFSIYLCVQQIGKNITTHTYNRLLYGQDHIREELHLKIDPEDPPAVLAFEIGPSAFFQPNPLQAEKLFSTALNMAQINSDSVVYDLYCGTGTIGICISKYVKQVIGIEISTESAMCARINAKRNHCKNVTIFSGAVRNLRNHISSKGIPRPDLVIIDPPRHGIDPEAMKHLLALLPPKILYIACNPLTQATNIKELIQKGYVLKAIQPFDYFPQTGQVKNIALLSLA